MSTFAAVQAALGEELQDVVDAGNLSDQQFGRSIEFAGYPAVRYYIDGFESKLLAGGAGGSTYRHGVRYRLDIIQERSEKDPDVAELDLLNALEAVVLQLQANWALAGTDALLDAPNSTNAGEQQAAMGNTIMVSLLVTPKNFQQYTS